MAIELITIALAMLASANICQSAGSLLPEIDPNRGDEFVGYYAMEEEVDTLTLIHIDASDINFVSSTGRQVGNYWEHGNPVYYYFANENMPRITSVRAIYDDMDSFIFMVNQLEETSNIIFPAYNNGFSLPNFVLGYLRSLTSRYTSFTWSACAGNIGANEWTDTLESISTRGLRFREFFRRYVPEGEYNYYVHEPSGTFPIGSNLIFGKSISDPYDSEISIDIPHLFASMDAYFYNTDENELLLSACGLHKYNIVDLCSWAGDLHTQVNVLREENISEIDISTLLDNNFALEDLISDIDACNIAKMYLDEGYSVSYALGHYYDVSNLPSAAIPSYRYDQFVTSVLNYPDGYGDTGQSWLGTIREQFYREIYYSLGIKINAFANGIPTSWEEGPAHSSSFYYTLMPDVPIPDGAYLVRVRCASLLSYYLLSNTSLYS